MHIKPNQQPSDATSCDTQDTFFLRNEDLALYKGHDRGIKIPVGKVLILNNMRIESETWEALEEKSWQEREKENGEKKLKSDLGKAGYEQCEGKEINDKEEGRK